MRSEHDSVSLAMETQPHDPPVFAPHMRGTCTGGDVNYSSCSGHEMSPVPVCSVRSEGRLARSLAGFSLTHSLIHPPS